MHRLTCIRDLASRAVFARFILPVRHGIGIGALRRKTAQKREKAPPGEGIIPQRFAKVDPVFAQEIGLNVVPIL